MSAYLYTQSKPHLYLLGGVWFARVFSRNRITGSSYLLKHAGNTPFEAYRNLASWLPLQPSCSS